MPYFSRQVGTVSSLITVFIPDRTVSTGAGLANIVASTVRFTWLRSDMSAVSSWTLTTGTLGTWASSTMTQVGSTSTLGAYQFSLPHGLFVSGDTAYAQIMSSTATFAEVPLVFDLTKTDNQTYLSSQTIGFVRNNVSVSTITTPVGVTTGVVSVSSATIPFGVSSISTPVTASSVSAAVGVSTLPAITSMTVGVNVTSIHGSAAVTSAAGVFGPLAVSSVTDKTGYSASAGVTTITIPVGVSTGSVAVTSATAGVNEGIADALLLRNVSSGANTGRTVREALYVLRNKVDANLGIVYATDDTTSSWAFTVSTVAGDPIQVIDPA